MEAYSPEQIMYAWLGLGILLVLIDTLHLGGVGMIFAGFGALTVGAGIAYDGHALAVVPLYQGIIFAVSSALWTVLLWKPLQKFRIPKAGHEYHNIVGDTAYVGSAGLNKKTGGEVTWSGTIMKAQLAAYVPVDRIDAGSQVEVVDVKGATLIVKPK